MVQVMTQYATDSNQKVHAENVSRSKKYQPHSYMSAEVTCDRLYTLCDYSNEKLSEIMIKILGRSLEKVPTTAETLLKIHKTGYTDAWDLKTMQKHDIADDSFGKSFYEIYDNKSLHDCVMLGTSPNDIKAVLATLPKNVIASFGYINPVDSVGFEEEEFHDTAEEFIPSSDPIEDFERQNSWKACKKMTISVTYDAGKLDSEEAGLLMSHIRRCVQDPDLIHL